MSVLDIFSGRLRTEMRQRVDEVLKCGTAWNKTAGELIEAINRLTDSIQKGNTTPADSKAVARAGRKLAKETGRLTRAFAAHNQTLAEILVKIG